MTEALPNAPLAFIGNGHIGIRVGRIPLVGGYAHVNGFWAMDDETGVPALARAPYPLAGDVVVDGIAASSSPGGVSFVDQRLDFASGELISRFAIDLGAVRATAEVTTFCSRTDPALVLQEVMVRPAAACDLTIVAAIDATGIPGEIVQGGAIPTGLPPTADAQLTFEAPHGTARCGLAIATMPVGAETEGPAIEPTRDGRLRIGHRFHAVDGRAVGLRSIVAVVPDLAHARPERQAALLVARGMARGWDTLRAGNRAAWNDLWLAHPLIDSRDPWQRLADASFYYLHSNASPASLNGTGVFGMAPTPGYHGYLGHVMWDVESFALPPVVLTHPATARALLRFRSRTAPAARRNAALHGYDGLQYPWEADFDQGEEAVPRWSMADKDHISLDVGLAFILHATITGDRLFARLEALPVIAGVAEWLMSRIEWTRRGVEIRSVRGPAEAFQPVDNDAFVNLAAVTFLRRAADLLRWLGEEPPAGWEAVADAVVIPRDPRTGAIVNHDAYVPSERLGETPEAAVSFFPLGYREGRATERATLRYALRHQVPRYVGTPMYSAVLGVHAAWLGLRRRSAELFESGYAAFFDDPFLAPDEYTTADPEFPPAGPMMANLGAFLSSLLYGLPGILPTVLEPRSWPERRVVLPAGWQSIEAARLWVRGRPTRLVAAHGMARAQLVDLTRPVRAVDTDRIEARS
jgi:trehalose/maltose hydrolase-like predicted phosphorylase